MNYKFLIKNSNKVKLILNIRESLKLHIILRELLKICILNKNPNIFMKYFDILFNFP